MVLMTRGTAAQVILVGDACAHSARKMQNLWKDLEIEIFRAE